MPWGDVPGVCVMKGHTLIEVLMAICILLVAALPIIEVRRLLYRDVLESERRGAVLLELRNEHEHAVARRP